MSSIKLESNPSGSGIFTIASPNSSTNRTLTLPDATGTIITTAGGAAISGTTGAFTTTVGVGGATPAASGAGITFPATQSASSDANTLDDYEEGTWTPVIDSATPGTGRVTNVSSAKYTKIGNVVTIHCYIGMSTLGTGGSGVWVVNGLPFTVASGNYGALSVPYSSSLNGNLVFISARADPSTTTIYVTGQSAAGTTFSTITFSTYVKVNTDIIIGGSYFTT